MKKGGSQPESKSKQDDGGQNLTPGENDEQSRVLSSSPEHIGLNTSTEDHGRIRKRSLDCPDEETSESFGGITSLYGCWASAVILSGFRSGYYASFMEHIERFDDRCLAGTLTSFQKAQALLDALDVLRKDRFMNRDSLQNALEEINTRWPIEDTSKDTAQKQQLRDHVLSSSSVLWKSRERKIVKRDNVISATRMVSYVRVKGHMTSLKKIKDEVKACEGNPGLSEPSCELSESGQDHNSNTKTEGVMPISEECALSTTGRTSDLATPSNIHLQANMSSGSYIAGGTAGPDPSHEQTPTQDVVEPLKDKVETPWVPIASKQLQKQPLHYPSKVTAEKRDPYFFPEDDYYDKYRAVAKGLWDTVNSYKDQADAAYRKRNYKEAQDLSHQANKARETAELATLRAGQDIYVYRNEEYILESYTFDLHGQHEKDGMDIFLLFLELAVYVRCFRQLRVITGHGSNNHGPAKQKDSVIKLLGDEKINWEYEIIRWETNGIEPTEVNPGVLLIKFDDEKRELDFVKYRSYSN